MDNTVLYKSGDAYGSLTLTGKCYKDQYCGKERKFVECLCVCGKIFFTLLDSIRGGGTSSCGCSRIRPLTHGLNMGRKTHPILLAWRNINERCYNPKDVSFKNYGGIGVKVSDEWRNDFMAFYSWAVSNGWKKGLSIDRIDNKGDYSPLNCRWATRATQSRNTRRNNFITMFGETKVLTDWIKDVRCKSSYTEFYRRIKRNMTPQEALITPTKFCK